jgi:mannose-6-phosphate isomerase-like protein (cupin superfamily)
MRRVADTRKEIHMTTRENHENTEATDGQTATRTFWFLGHRFTVLADHTDTGGRYDLIEGRQPAGSQTPPHRHTRYDEQLYVLDGERTVWVGERKVVLRAGETFAIPAGAAHVVAATGAGPAHALVIASPSGFARLIQEAGTPDIGGAPPQPTPADLERFGRIAAEVGDEILGPPGALPEA